MDICRRKFVAAGISIAAGSLLPTIPSFAQQKTLRIQTFGGIFDEPYKKLVVEPFEKEHDVKIELVAMYASDALAQIRAQKASPQMDVVLFTAGQEVLAVKEGLLAPISPGEMTHYKDLYPVAQLPMDRGAGPVIAFIPIVFAYNSKMLSNPPKSWRALIDSDLGDKIALSNVASTNGLYTLLGLNTAAGGNLENIEPGLQATKKLIDNGAQIIATGPELQNAVAQEVTSFFAYEVDYAHDLKNAGLPIEYFTPEDGTYSMLLTANVVAGRPNIELAKKFVEFAARPEAQLGFAETSRYAPTVKTAKLPPAIASEVIYGEEQVSRLLELDSAVVQANRPAWVEKWNKAVAG